MSHILFIAPLPPPISGHTLQSEVLLKHLQRDHEVTVVDLAPHSTNDGTLTGKRVVTVAKILAGIWRHRSKADVLYMTISESFWGNVKDILIYVMCFAKLNRLCIHLQGGSIERELFEKCNTIRKINHFFLSKLACVIVTGPSHVDIFREALPTERIHVVPNFAEDEIFIDVHTIEQKFQERAELRVLYLSTLMERKGFREVLDGYAALDESVKRELKVDVAGRIPSTEMRESLVREMGEMEGVVYHGVVKGHAKRRLLWDAHALCLPSSFFEGQPLCVLEAYAAGCVALVTPQPGILDVFGPGTNGFLIEERTPEAVRDALERLAVHGEELEEIALRNRTMAEQSYTELQFGESIGKILGNAAQDSR